MTFAELLSRRACDAFARAFALAVSGRPRAARARMREAERLADQALAWTFGLVGASLHAPAPLGLRRAEPRPVSRKRAAS